MGFTAGAAAERRRYDVKTEAEIRQRRDNLRGPAHADFASEFIPNGSPDPAPELPLEDPVPIPEKVAGVKEGAGY